MLTKTGKYAIIYSGVTTCILYLTLPVAAPIIWQDMKQAIAGHMRDAAQELAPRAEINPVQVATLAKAQGKENVLPPRMDVAQFTAQYPAGNSDIIGEILGGKK